MTQAALPGRARYFARAPRIQTNAIKDAGGRYRKIRASHPIILIKYPPTRRKRGQHDNTVDIVNRL